MTESLRRTSGDTEHGFRKKSDHPFRTYKQERQAKNDGHGQYIWLDWRLVTSPAFKALALTGKMMLVIFVGKYGRATKDGDHGDDFTRGVTFSTTDVQDLRISSSAFWDNLRSLEEYGFIKRVHAGHMTKKGERNKGNTFVPSDAWRASLRPIKARNIDVKRNLPWRDDPSRLPELMALCKKRGDDCIWFRYENAAVSRVSKDEDRHGAEVGGVASENRIATVQNLDTHRPKTGVPRTPGEASDEGSNVEERGRDKGTALSYGQRGTVGGAPGAQSADGSTRGKSAQRVRRRSRNEQTDFDSHKQHAMKEFGLPEAEAEELAEKWLAQSRDKGKNA